jgi:proteasome-associated ATPase
MSTDEPRDEQQGTRERLEAERASLEAEITALRARGQGTPAQLRTLERDLTGLRSQLATVSAQNERLVRTLRDAREQIVTLKSEVDRLAQPPAAYGIVIEAFDDGTADILTSGRKMHVAVSPSLEEGQLVPGREVMLNEAMNVVAAHGYETTGEVVLCKEILDDGRVLVVAQADEERVCRVAASLEGQTIRAGDALLLESRSGFVFERIPKAPTSCSRRCPTSTTPTSAGSPARSRPSATPSSCRTCTPTSTSSTSSSRRRASCSTARPAAARR